MQEHGEDGALQRMRRHTRRICLLLSFLLVGGGVYWYATCDYDYTVQAVPYELQGLWVSESSFTDPEQGERTLGRMQEAAYVVDGGNRYTVTEVHCVRKNGTRHVRIRLDYGLEYILLDGDTPGTYWLSLKQENGQLELLDSIRVEQDK